MGEAAGLIFVALGAAIGGPLRFYVSGLVGRRIGETFPFGTLAVNVIGSFLIGLAGATLPHRGALSLFAVAGVLGSFTTASSFSLQTLALARGGDFLRAGANVVLSLALCLAAVAIGFLLGAALAGSAA